MSAWFRNRVVAYQQYAGTGLLGSQLLLLAVGLSVWAIQWLLVGHAGLTSTLAYTFVAGNVVTLLMFAAIPLYDQPFPRDWIVYFALLIPVAFTASAAGGVLSRMLLRVPLRTLGDLRSGDVPFGALICFVLGTSVHIYWSTRTRLQAANSKLAQQVQYGRQELATQASDLRDAFEIQSSLLPRTIPQIAGVEISCAWQPARTVSGDYFDVIVLSESRSVWLMSPARG